MRSSLLWVLLSSFAQAQVTSTSTVRYQIEAGSWELFSDRRPLLFQEVVLNGYDQESSGVQAPTITVRDATGSQAGWTLFLQCSPFTGERGGVVPASALTFRSQSGALVRLLGAPIGAGGPRESGLTGSLATPQLVLVAAPGSGMGTYQWSPNPRSFSLKVPANANSGVYRATLTVTRLGVTP
jgi:hypothetical protein